MFFERFTYSKQLAKGQSRFLYFLILFFLVINTILSVIYPFIYKYFIDEVLFKQQLQNLSLVLIMMVTWLVLSLFFNFLSNKCQNKYVLVVGLNVKRNVFKIFLKKKLSYYRENGTSDMKQILEDDVKEVEDFYKKDIFTYILSASTVLFLIIIMFALNPLLLACCMIFFCFSYFETKLINQKVKNNSILYRKALTEENTLRMGEFDHFVDVKCLNIKDSIVKNFIARSNKLCEYIVAEKILEYKNKYFGALNHDLITRFFIYMVGGVMVVSGDFMTSSFLVFLGFYESFIKNVRAMIDSNFAFSNRKIKINKLLNVLISSNSDSNGINVEESIDTLKCTNISFNYPDKEKEILKNFSYTFYSGNIYLLQGESGIGKSTVINLLLSDYIPCKGKIFLNNYDIQDIDLESYYSKINIARVDSRIFNGTIKENLLVANPTANDEELKSACEKSKFLSDVLSFPEKFEYMVGENGMKLSGGQRERLIITRLFLRKAQVYLLDEALAEVSANDEIEIYKNLINENPKAIYIIVSHRISEYNGWKIIKFSTNSI